MKFLSPRFLVQALDQGLRIRFDHSACLSSAHNVRVLRIEDGHKKHTIRVCTKCARIFEKKETAYVS